MTAALESQHPLRCHCGAVHGHVMISAAMTCVICYCKDCQSFTHFLGKEKEILNERDGTNIVPVSPRGVVFTQGKELLMCMRLSPKRLLRWYTQCCSTPIGNTSASNKLAYVGLVHTCLEYDSASLDQSFGPVRMQVHPQSAKTSVNAKSSGTLVVLIKLIAMLLRERISGGYKHSPFFDAVTGKPIAVPTMLTFEERQSLRGNL